MVTLRPMEADDLALVERWLSEPHVARWYLAGSSLAAELEDIRESVAEGSGTHVLVVLHDDEPIGWCQWYPCDVDPAWAAEVGAEPGDVGVDYAIGDETRVGAGVGTELIAVLVRLVRSARPGCGIVADPDAQNRASRRVLEKNGFELVAVKSMESEPSDEPMAIYRQPPKKRPRAGGSMGG
jgi:RimJ/RimL family protein N-acetyltransferase